MVLVLPTRSALGKTTGIRIVILVEVTNHHTHDQIKFSVRFHYSLRGAAVGPVCGFSSSPSKPGAEQNKKAV